jgi:hypothetical protein
MITLLMVVVMAGMGLVGDMLSTILSWVSGGIVGQIGKQLNQAYGTRLKAKNDHERVEADKELERLRTLRKAMEEDGKVRLKKLGHWMGRTPLFIAELSAGLYFSSIMIDSTFPMQWLTPLELPEWFKPQFTWAMASIFGLSIVARKLR